MVFHFNFSDQFMLKSSVIVSLLSNRQHCVFTERGHRVPVYVRLKTAHCSFSMCLCVDPSL